MAVDQPVVADIHDDHVAVEVRGVIRPIAVVAAELDDSGVPRLVNSLDLESKSEDLMDLGQKFANRRQSAERPWWCRVRELEGDVVAVQRQVGIDIGALEAAVLTGYPGTVASTLQQMGRVGRRDKPSIAALVLSSSPLPWC